MDTDIVVTRFDYNSTFIFVVVRYIDIVAFSLSVFKNYYYFIHADRNCSICKVVGKYARNYEAATARHLH